MATCHVVLRFNTSLDDSMGAFLWDDPDLVKVVCETNNNKP